MILRDAVAIALTFCWSGVVFSEVILFTIGNRRLKDKLERFKRVKTTKYREKCFSIEWERDKGRRNIMGARGLHLMIPSSAAFLISFILFSIFPNAGYAMFIPFLGLPIFLDNAIEMYRYSRAVQKAPLEILQDKDKEYMEEALEVLATRPKVYSIVGTMFLIAAPFIPHLFNLLPSFMREYTRPAFFLVERLGIFLGLFVMLILFIALPTVLVVEHKWTIRQMKRLTEWMRSKIRRSES